MLRHRIATAAQVLNDIHPFRSHHNTSLINFLPIEKETLHISVTSISIPFLTQLILYRFGCCIVFKLSVFTTLLDMILSVLPLSINTSHTLPLIVQRVQKMECLCEGFACFGAIKIRSSTQVRMSPSSPSNSSIYSTLFSGHSPISSSRFP